MIQTKTRNLIIVGNWNRYLPKWVPLEESSNLDEADFFGVRPRPRPDFSRVIDSFEYVVRPFRTRYYGSDFGRETTIQYSFWSYSDLSSVIESLKKFNQLPNNKNTTLFAGAIGFRLGIPDTTQNQLERDDYNISDSFGYASSGYNKYLSSGQLSNAHNLGGGSLKELWMHVTNLYEGMFYWKRRGNISIGLFKEIVNFWSEKYNCNIKFLSVDDYLEVLSWYESFHMSDDEAYEYVYDMKWFSQPIFESYKKMMERSYKSPKIYTKRHWFNRGFEAIINSLMDDRFKSYGIYFHGLHSLGLMKNRPGEFLTEHMALTDLMNKGRLKYFTAEFKNLHEEYIDSFEKYRWNLFK